MLMTQLLLRVTRSSLTKLEMRREVVAIRTLHQRVTLHISMEQLLESLNQKNGSAVYSLLLQNRDLSLLLPAALESVIRNIMSQMFLKFIVVLEFVLLCCRI
uniref:Putative ovule protein n=1 Tax=Solanum chacoense TaxID=4108 RepID=A0A0V0H4V6_SOLCH